jgi:hypothetical protein
MIFLWNLSYKKARGAALLVKLYYKEIGMLHNNGFKRLRSLATKVEDNLAPEALEK